MANAFDARIIQVTIFFEDGAQTYEGLSIYASGQKFLGALMNTGSFKIYNLTKEQRNYILSKTTPLNLQRQPVRIALDVGRESYGTFRLFDGYVIASGVTQPPDIAIILDAFTNNYLANITLFNVQSSVTQLSVIAQQIATNNNLILSFQATDRQIENYSYSGAAAYQINDLNAMGGIIAHVNNGVLTVLNSNATANAPAITVNSNTGMVGIPEFTETGIIVKTMIQSNIELGNLMHLQSKVVPAADGDYKVQRIFYEVASRDQAFFYTLDCISLNYYSGTI